MDNPETQAILSTQDTERRPTKQKNTQQSKGKRRETRTPPKIYNDFLALFYYYVF